MSAPWAFERDPYLTELSVRVVGTGTDEGRPWAALDDTILYPEGGGQPGDHGHLGDVPVLDVKMVEGVVRHSLAGPVQEGPTVVRLDWRRRFDHMQHHTGQHLLTAVAADRLGWETTAFHLGPEACDIELAASSIDPTALARLEEEVAADHLSVVIAKAPCALLVKDAKDPYAVDEELCTKCGACIRLGCPAISKDEDGRAVIDTSLCVGCGQCVQVCRFDAIQQVGPSCDIGGV